MIKKLIKLATHMIQRGLVKEADYLDGIIKKAQAKPVYVNTLNDFPKKKSAIYFYRTHRYSLCSQ